MSDFNNNNKLHKLQRNVKQERNSIRDHLKSIVMDSKFIYTLNNMLPEFKIIGNLRNGVWYIPESLKEGECYFKSTDGHDNIWNFSLTRMNLNLYKIAYEKNQGCIVVDGTRRGKDFPDSLSATIPIWCSILNYISGSTPIIEFDAPPWFGSSTINQIEHRLQQLIKELPVQIKEYIIQQCRESNSNQLPLRPIWVHRNSLDGCFDFRGDYADTLLDFEFENENEAGSNGSGRGRGRGYVPLVLYSASSVVTEGQHAEQHSWTYIQGAGDDEEEWAKGLTPHVFWRHYDTILAYEDALQVDEAVENIINNPKKDEKKEKKGENSNDILIPIGKSGLYLGDRLQNTHDNHLLDEGMSLIVINNNNYIQDSPSSPDASESTSVSFTNPHSFIHHSSNKLEIYLGSTLERPNRAVWSQVLKECVTFAGRHRTEGRRIGILCEDGKRACVTVAMVVLLSYPSLFSFGLSLDLEMDTDIELQIRKKDVKEVLLRLQSVHPTAAPPRSLMKIVNDFFMSYDNK